MANSELTPEDLAKIQHQDWLKHPVTQDLLKNLTKHKRSFLDISISKAGDSSVNELEFRLQAYGARTTEAIISLVNNTEQFINKTKEKN